MSTLSTLQSISAPSNGSRQVDASLIPQTFRQWLIVPSPAKWLAERVAFSSSRIEADFPIQMYSAGKIFGGVYATGRTFPISVTQEFR